MSEWEKLKMLLLRRKADGDVQKDEEQKQKGQTTYTLDFSIPLLILAAPLPLHYLLISLPLRRPLCNAMAVPVILDPSQTGVSCTVLICSGSGSASYCVSGPTT